MPCKDSGTHSIRIEPEDLWLEITIGYLRSPIFPEDAVEWNSKRNQMIFEKRSGDAFFPDENTKQELLELCKYWEHKTTLDKGRALFTEELAAMHESAIIKAEGNLTSGDAHIAAHFRQIMDKGLAWYRQQAEQKLAQTDFVTAEDLRKRNFYQSVMISMDAFSHHILRLQTLPERWHKKKKMETGEMKPASDRAKCHHSPMKSKDLL